MMSASMPETSAKTFVLWVPNVKNPEQQVPISFYRGVIVNPSHTGQAPPHTDCSTRASSPEPGDYEDCVLVLAPSRRSYTAYPVTGSPVIKFPGITEPTEITWQANEQRPGEMIATIWPKNSPHYARVFVGAANRHDEISPEPGLSKPWDGQPTAGDKVMCYIAYHIGQTGIVGYAYPDSGRKPLQIEEHQDVVFLGDFGICIPREDGWHGEGWQTEDEVHLTFRRKP